jgi:hypothetical protein
MSFWKAFWDFNAKVSVGGLIIAFIGLMILYPIGAVIHDKYFKKSQLYQCKVLSTVPGGSILVMFNESIIQKRDNLSKLNLRNSDTMRLNAGSLLIIGSISQDSTYAKIYFQGGWKGNTQLTGYVPLEYLDCWRLVQPN